MSRTPFMPIPLCSKPGCGEKMKDIQIVQGLGVSHCRHHKDWALDEAKTAADRQAAELAGQGALAQPAPHP